jgi:hypothetical protein
MGINMIMKRIILGAALLTAGDSLFGMDRSFRDKSGSDFVMKEVETSDSEYIKPVKKPRKKRGIEARHIRKKLRGFDMENSEAFHRIKQHFINFTYAELLSVAKVLYAEVLPAETKEKVYPPGRDEGRSFEVLMKWFHCNWSEIGSFIYQIQLRDEHFVVIDQSLIEEKFPEPRQKPKRKQK